MARIAVVVPVYNVENYLERCINSILNQSFQDFKLILINDGSTDNSLKICELYQKSYNNIELIDQENMGLSVARNRGIERSSEKYIIFIDSDDYIHREMFKMLYENLIENQADISVGNHKKIYNDQKLSYRKADNIVRILSNIEAVERIVNKNDANMIIACGKLYKRSLFKDIRYPKDKYHEDEFVTYKLLYKSNKVVTSSAQLYYYTQRDKSITGDRYSLKRLEKLEALKEAIEFFNSQGDIYLEIGAKYRYLLNIQIAYYRIKFELSDEKQALRDLKSQYNLEYKKIKEHSEEISIIKK